METIDTQSEPKKTQRKLLKDMTPEELAARDAHRKQQRKEINRRYREKKKLEKQSQTDTIFIVNESLKHKMMLRLQNELKMLHEHVKLIEEQITDFITDTN